MLSTDTTVVGDMPAKCVHVLMQPRDDGDGAVDCVHHSVSVEAAPWCVTTAPTRLHAVVGLSDGRLCSIRTGCQEPS
jgi:hypothetical protein